MDVAPLGQTSASPGVFLKDLRGGFEEQVAGGPLVGAGALHHEDATIPLAGFTDKSVPQAPAWPNRPLRR